MYVGEAHVGGVGNQPRSASWSQLRNPPPSALSGSRFPFGPLQINSSPTWLHLDAAQLQLLVADFAVARGESPKTALASANKQIQ